MRGWTIALMMSLVALAGCVGQQSDATGGAPSQTGESDGPVFDNETFEGNITVATSGPKVYEEGDEPPGFDVVSGTRTLTLDLVWSGSEEIRMRVYNRDSHACENQPEDCTLHWATTEDGEATLTLSNPDAGTYDLSFFAESEPTSGTYVVEVQREIWPE